MEERQNDVLFKMSYKQLSVQMFKEFFDFSKVCNILVHACFWHAYRMTKVVETMQSTHCGWSLVHWHIVHCFNTYDLKVTHMNEQQSNLGTFAL